MKYRIAQVIGLNTDQEAAQVLSSSREDNNIFFGVLQISCDDAFTKGRQILTELMDDFFDPPTGGDETVAKKLTDIFTQAKEKLGEVAIINLLLGSVSGKALYIMYEGDSTVYLKRSGKLSSLLAVGQPNQLISGFLQEKDRVFFGTANLTKLLGDDLSHSIDSPLSEWEEDVTIRISTSSLNNQGLAGLLLDAVPEPEAGVKKTNDEYAVDSFEPRTPITIPEKTVTKGIGIFKSMLPQFFSKKDSRAVTDNVQETAVYTVANPTQSKGFFIKKFFPKSGRSKLLLGSVLILLVIAGAGYQFKKNQDAETQQILNQYLQQARDDLAAAESISTLNVEEAKVKLESAKANTDKALAVKAGNQEALDLKQRIISDSDRILQQFSSANFPVYLELDLIKPDLRPQRMSLSGNTLLLLDSNGKSLVSIDITKKSQNVLAGAEQVGDAKFATINDDFGFIYSADKGILKIDVSNQKITSAVKADSDLVGAVDIAGFGTNIYLLDKTSNQIWKFIGTTSGYSDKRAYLLKDVTADFTDAKRLQIDSAIYILHGNGNISRYLKGANDNFSYSGLDKPIKDPKSFFVSADTENLYILDSGNSRLVVTDKTGAYKAQYQGELFATALDLVIDEKGKKVYLLDNGKIYQTDLK